MSKIIAIDFDGTLVTHEFPEIGQEKPNASRVLERLLFEDYTLIIWTCRSGPDLIGVYEWLASRGLQEILVNTNVPYQLIKFQPHPKIYADLYIDDRQLGGIPDDWEDIYKLIHNE